MYDPFHSNATHTEKYKRAPCSLVARKTKTWQAHAFTFEQKMPLCTQKSASKLNPWVLSPPAAASTPAFWYSPTRFSKKLVFPCKEISSIQSNGFCDSNIFGCPRDVSNLSAKNSMYFVISSLFIPIRSHGNASQMNSLSAATAPLIRLWTTWSGSLFCNML